MFQWCLGLSWPLLFLHLKGKTFGYLSLSQWPGSHSLLLLVVSIDCCCHSHHFHLLSPILQSSHSVSAAFSFLSAVPLQGLPARVWGHWTSKCAAGQLNSTFLSYNWSSQLPQFVRCYLWLLSSQMYLVTLSSKKRTYFSFSPGYPLLWSHSKNASIREIKYRISAIQEQ